MGTRLTLGIKYGWLSAVIASSGSMQHLLLLLKVFVLLSGVVCFCMLLCVLELCCEFLPSGVVGCIG